MRSTLFGKSDYFLRIKRKPAQEALLQKVREGKLTDEEIENCGQPLWVREALSEIKRRGGFTQWEIVDKVIAQTEADQAAAARQHYPVYRWDIPNAKPDVERGWDTDLLYGDLILVDRPRGQVKIQYSLFNWDDARIAQVEAMGTYVGEATDPGFIELVAQNRTARKLEN